MRVEVREDGFMIDQWALLDTGADDPEGKLRATTVPARPDRPWLRADPQSFVIDPKKPNTIGVWYRPSG